MPRWYVITNYIIDVGLIGVGIAAAVLLEIAVSRIIGN